MRSSEMSGVKRKMVVAMVASALLGTSAVAQDAPVRLGVLTDMSSLYADNGGQGSVVAAQMAVDDFGGKVLGRSIQIVASDHQNKADVGAAIARRWLDNEGVEAILDVPNSAVALAVQGIARDKKRLFLATGAATSRLTGDECSLTGIHWTYDNMPCRRAQPRRSRDLAQRAGSFSRPTIRSGRSSRPTAERLSRQPAAGSSAQSSIRSTRPISLPSCSRRSLQRRT